MSTTTLSLQLSQQLQVFVNEQVAEGGYSNASEYIATVLEQIRRQMAKKKLEALLLEGLDSGEPIEVTEEWWDEERAKTIARLRQANG